MFHVKEGLYFERLPTGDVRIVKHRPVSHGSLGLGNHIEMDITIDAASWASVVAHVTEHGGNAATFNRAEALHAGRLG